VGEGAIDADGAVERETYVALHVRASRVAGEPIERRAAHPVGDQAGEAIQQLVERPVAPPLAGAEERRSEVPDDEPAIDGHETP
jgi:hypothetical protein